MKRNHFSVCALVAAGVMLLSSVTSFAAVDVKNISRGKADTKAVQNPSRAAGFKRKDIGARQLLRFRRAHDACELYQLPDTRGAVSSGQPRRREKQPAFAAVRAFFGRRYTFTRRDLMIYW